MNQRLIINWVLIIAIGLFILTLVRVPEKGKPIRERIKREVARRIEKKETVSHLPKKISKENLIGILRKPFKKGKELTGRQKEIIVEYAVAKYKYMVNVRPILEKECGGPLDKKSIGYKEYIQRLHSKEQKWWEDWFKKHDTTPAECFWITEKAEKDPKIKEQLKQKVLSIIPEENWKEYYYKER